MPSAYALLLLLPTMLVALLDWRKGLVALLCVGFLQDPARKLAIDEPVYYTLLVGLVFAVAFLRAQMDRPTWPSEIAGWDHYLRWPVLVLLVVLVAQGVNSIVRYGNPIIAGIGAVSYLAPLPALLLGYRFALRSGYAGVRRWLAWYLVGALLILPSVALQFAGVEWRTLGQVGAGFVMHVPGFTLTANSGFFRASETAAWHVATAVSLLLLVGSMQRLSTRQATLAVVVVVALIAIGILTGRRKILVEIAIYLAAYIGLLLHFGKGGGRLTASILLGGLVSWIALTVIVPDAELDLRGVGSYVQGTEFRHYAERGATVTSDIGERAIELGFQPIAWAIEGFGWLGGGLGVASQGAQHFGGGGEVFGGAGEGGLGKVTAELGIPGLALAVWFVVAAARYLWNVLVFVSWRSSAVARLAYGLTALLLANLAVFFVATQVFGDLFVQLLLGLIGGFLLATPVLAERERARGAIPISRPTIAQGGVPSRLGAQR